MGLERTPRQRRPEKVPPVERLRAQDPSAWKDLFQTMNKKMVDLAESCSPGNGEQIAQEVWLNFYKKMGGLEDSDNLVGYLTTSIINSAKNVNKYEGRRSYIYNSELLEKMDTVKGKTNQSTEAEVLKKMSSTSSRLNEILDELKITNPGHRTSLLLTSAGFTTTEIAKMTEKPRNTVCTDIFKARRKAEMTIKQRDRTRELDY